MFRRRKLDPKKMTKEAMDKIRENGLVETCHDQMDMTELELYVRSLVKP